MNPDRASFVTAIAALFSCSAAIANVIITCYLTKYNARATRILESEKLFFNAKAEAYHALLRSASAFQSDPSNENLLSLESACTYAILFSSESAEDALSSYGNALVAYQDEPSSPVLFQELVHAQAVAMRTMKNELNTMTN